MELDGVGRGSGGKRVTYLADKLSAGGAASEADIRTAVDEFYEPSADGGDKQAQVTYECLSLLCGGAAGGECGGGVVGGGRFAESEAFVDKLSSRLERDRAQQRRQSVDGSAEVAQAAVQLVSSLPEETLCKVLANREATTTLQGYAAEHPNAALRAFSISRLASACVRCWSFLDRRAFVNGGFEEGGDAQRYKQRVRDWIHDFFSSVPKLCDDPSNIVAAAAFSAIEALLREHPLCETAVDKEVRGFWGLEGDVQPEEKGGVEEGGGRKGPSGGMFGGHKQAFPLQHVGEIVLRSALPRIRRLLHRQSRMVVDGEPQTAAPAIRACASLMVAALRLSTSPSGMPIENSLLQNPTSVDFLGVKKNTLSSGSSGNDAGAEGSTGNGEEEDLDATLPPKDLAEEWLGARLGVILEGGRGGDALLVETAAWAMLRVLQTVAMGPLRVSVAPRVAEAFLRVLVAGKAATPRHLWPSLHAGHQEVAAGSALALRLASPSATTALAPHVLAAAERVPQPRQRLALLADVFFLLLVRPGRNGRAPCDRGGSGSGGGEGNDDRQGGGGGTGSSRTGAPRDGAKMLASVLDEEWFGQLVSDSPGSSARRVLFREEAVAVLVTTCAQVLAAGVVAALSPAAEKAAAVGIGSLARSCDSKRRATVAPSDTSEGHQNGASVGNGTANFAASVSAAAAARAAAAAERGRWSDLETWLDCSLTALEACTRCVNWNSKTGYVGGLAYVRLLSLVLRLLCPLAAAPAESGDDKDSASTADRVLLGGRSYGGGGKGGVDVGVALDDGSTAGGGQGRLAWARQRLAHVVDDLMWRLREGLPGRDIRLRLLQATCTHVGLSAVVSGDVGLTEDSANELVSVLQGELGELDAQAGFSTQPRPARAATSGGDEPGDGDDGNRGGDAHAGRGGGSSGSPAAGGGGGGGGAAAPQGQGGDDGAAGREAGAGGQWESISSVSGRTGSLTDVMAHKLVIGCLVRLALVTEGETAHEVMSVLEHERGRARVRERLGRGAIGPMEEVVAKGIRALQLLVLPATSPKVADGSVEAVLLKRLVRTMDLGWHAVVQPDERALTGSSAELFDHEAHAFPYLHRRLRRLLCGGIGADTANVDERRSTGNGDFPGDLEARAAAVITPFEAHGWEEEAPQAQLNGGSDPVVVIASHVVYHGGSGGGACGATGGGGRALGPTTHALAFAGVGGDATAPATMPGVVGKVASRGVGLRIRVFNATNTRLHGFFIRLSFGQGGEAAGMGGGGRVESAVQEVLMPSAAHTLEVPVTPLDVLTDVVVHVSVVFPDTEPESEFESEGTAELLGVESTEKSRGGDRGGGDGGSNAVAGFGQNQPSFDGGGGDTEVDGGASSSVTMTLQAGSYRVPAEAFLGPPERAAAAWVGFQSVWSGLPYVTAIPVESARHLPRARTTAAGQENGAASLRTASGVRLAMMPAPASSRGGGGRGGRGGDDARAAAAVECPVGNTDYAVSSAWVFQAWDGTPVLCALTAMKAPFSLLHTPGGGGKGGGGGGGQPSWYGRLEVRCGSRACLEFAQYSPKRLANFVTNGVFAPPADGNQQQTGPFGGTYLPTAPAATAVSGGGGLNGPHPDWFSRTDTVGLPPPPCPPEQKTEVLATDAATFKPLVRVLRDQQRVDTTQPATAMPLRA